MTTSVWSLVRLLDLAVTVIECEPAGRLERLMWNPWLGEPNGAVRSGRLAAGGETAKNGVIDIDHYHVTGLAAKIGVGCNWPESTLLLATSTWPTGGASVTVRVPRSTGAAVVDWSSRA